MEEQILSIGQMQNLIKQGLDVREASMYYDLSKNNSIALPMTSYTRKNIGTYEKYLPTFTFYDALVSLPEIVVNEGADYFLEVGKGTEMNGSEKLYVNYTYGDDVLFKELGEKPLMEQVEFLLENVGLNGDNHVYTKMLYTEEH